MLETTESLLPVSQKEKLRAILVSHSDESFEELERLLSTLSVESIERVPIAPRKIIASTYYGQGKLEEVKSKVLETKAHVVILDVELSPNQLRNLEKLLEAPVLDRPGVIIEIFSRNARTKEAKTQVALARLQYLLPRLKHFWTHFERQRGGVTGARGMGEKQIEVDRRLIKERMGLLKKRLQDIAKERHLHRSGRKDVLKVALVGYTNAGKSTLLNALTESQVLAEDKLFATLDSSVRILSPNTKPPVVAIDTVGFISRLPPSLIASFRSTLEELREADLLLHVVDGSSEQASDQIQTVLEILKELKLDHIPIVTVLNKVDDVKDVRRLNQLKVLSPGAPLISALRSEDVRRLRTHLLSRFEIGLEIWEVMIPYDQGKLESSLHTHAKVETIRHLNQGTFYRLRIDPKWAKKLELKRFRL